MANTPKSIWSGNISFGLMNVPVKLFSAVSDKSIHFRQINSQTGARVKMKRVDADTGNEVAYNDIVKGYELSPDRHVIVTAEDLEAIAPKKTKTIALEQFVGLDEIDPLAYNKPYYLGPGPGGGKAYRLLADAMREAGKTAIGRMVLRSTEYLVALSALDDGTIVCHTLLFADSINGHSDLGLEEVEPSKKERTMAVQLIKALSTKKFDYASLKDEYRENVLSLVESLAAGEKPTAPSEPEPSTADLLGALEASLQAVRDEEEPVPTPVKA